MTNNIRKRFHDHISTSLKPNNKNHSLIHRAIKKHGSQSFHFSVIEIVDNRTIASTREKYWIEFYQTYVPKYGDEFGYNLTLGGDGSQDGTSAGERNPKSKLTKLQALNIKTSSLPTKELSAIYNVGRTTIQRIRSGKIWKELSHITSLQEGNYPDRKGESSSRSKLDWEKVESLREDYVAGYKIADLSRKYNTSWTNVHFIIQNKTWVK